MRCWDPQFIFILKIPYSAGNIIASFTFYTAHIINVNNGRYIITHKSDMERFCLSSMYKPCLNCFEFQNINMISFCLMLEISRWGYSIGNSPTCKTSICAYDNVRIWSVVNMVAWIVNGINPPVYFRSCFWRLIFLYWRSFKVKLDNLQQHSLIF